MTASSDLLRQRQLHQDAVDRRVGVEAGDQVEELLLRRLRRQLVQPAGHADALAGLALVADVDLAGGVVRRPARRPGRAARRSIARTSPPRRRSPPPSPVCSLLPSSSCAGMVTPSCRCKRLERYFNRSTSRGSNSPDGPYSPTSAALAGRRPFQVHLDHLRPGVAGPARSAPPPGRRPRWCRRPGNTRSGRRPAGPRRHSSSGKRFVEPDHVRPQQRAARSQCGRSGSGSVPRSSITSAVGAAHARQAAVQFQHAAAAGGAVQAVHVLRGQGEALAEALFQATRARWPGFGCACARLARRAL